MQQLEFLESKKIELYSSKESYLNIIYTNIIEIRYRRKQFEIIVKRCLRSRFKVEIAR